MNEIIKRFENAIEKNRLSHLYLLSGSKGQTKKRLVTEIAYLIFKSGEHNEHLRQQLDNENYPNFIYVAKDGLSIKKEQILDLQREFSKTSLVGGNRIYVIEAAETMSLAAANSLLKFMEEPKDKITIGFLLTDDLNLILPTIRSRSQVILIESEKDELIEELANEGIDLKNATLISLLTDDTNEAIQTFNDQSYLFSVEIFDEIIEWITNPNRPLMFITNKLVAGLGNEKKYYEFILSLISNVMLDVIHTHINQKIDLEFLRESILLLVRRLSIKQAETVIKLIHETNKRLRYSVNVNLTINSFMIEFKDLILNAYS